MLISAAASIENQKQSINELNVFPVPDGDTGTNMSMTLNAAVADLRKADALSLDKAADITAGALLRGARGNSGVILSLLFRGFSKSFKSRQEADGALLAEALTIGVETAYKAIMKPTEGTILTVSRLAAAAATEAADTDACFEQVLMAAIEKASEALKQTVEQNPVLKKAGVVDAGGKGYLAILEGMLASLQGNDVEPAEGAAETKAAASFSDFDDEDILYTYCTEFIVSRDNDRDPALLHSFLSGVGDSLVQVDDDDIIKVHVHSNEPGNVITHALKYGALLTVKIENMREQHTEKVLSEAEQTKKFAQPEKTFGVVSVCAGPGLAEAFRDLGVDQIVEGGQTMNPSTQDILSAVNATPAEIVYVLPNNKNIILAAEQAVPLSEKKIVVIPTKTVPQGITSMLSFDASLEEASLTEAMMSAFDTVSTMQITYAARNSDFDGHRIQAGDYLGLFNGALFKTTQDISSILRAMAEQVRDEGKEFVSIFYGEDISEEDAKRTALAIFQETCPDAEVTLLYGGQPIYYYLISAE
ncbi:MAG: DAK2 domain-containing protein [Oscillospiraceae bacterium]|nr:DAK2 domain-containing protein [Oscillospiraceae bacterium]